MVRSKAPDQSAARDSAWFRGIVKLRASKSDTPNQSAARGTTLKLMFRRAIKTVRKVPEQGKEEMRVALEIRTVCGQKDQAQHPKGTRKKREKGREEEQER